MSRTAIPSELLEAYRATKFRVFAQTSFDLSVDDKSEPLLELFKLHDRHSAAFLTAWNPGSRPTSEEENRRAAARMEAELTRRNLPWIAGIGVDPSGEWPGEESVLVLGIDRETAIAVGYQFEQNAIVWADADGIPRLIVLQ